MNELSIVLAGEAGQGINSIETILVSLLKKTGYHIYATKEYMSRVRGGVNSIQIRVSCNEVKAFTRNTDIFLPFEKEAFFRLNDRINDNTIIIGNKSNLEDDRVIDIPFQKIASKFGNKLYANSVAVGVLSGLMKIDEEIMAECIKDFFMKKGEEMAAKNREASKSGYETGKNLIQNKTVKLDLNEPETKHDNMILSGTEAVSLGAIAGGCDSVFAYPMTPGSGVFTELAKQSHKAGILVEQAEDEISAVNMAIGGWYAGARPFVSTSGGGFALMTEGISLAGMTETPIVVHIAQRPGPATGLPTRTEQGDLNLSLYSGHGVIPRAIYAPGTTKQAFELSCKSFEMADKFQIPVIILTDQYFVDTYYDTPVFACPEEKIEKHIIETKDDYLRYELNDTGISPRGVPGYGSGFVCADSDEHDENGRITEDLDGISLKMKNKRFNKLSLIKEEALRPEICGSDDYENLVIAWGSTYNTIKEALNRIDDKKTAMLHFSQVFPLHNDTGDILNKAKNLLLVENNQTGQFGDLIKLETGINIEKKILKYNGLMFTVEELEEQIRSAFKN